VAGHQQVIAQSPELAGLFPSLRQARAPIGELPPALLAAIQSAQASPGMTLRHEWPLDARGTILEATVLNLGAGPLDRTVVALHERAGPLPPLDSLRRLDRLASLGTLSASMAHEVRNAFVAVKTFVDLLIEQNPSPELTSLVRREMSRIDALVGQMLRFAAPAQPASRSVSLHSTLEHTLRMVMPNLNSRAITLVKQFHAQPDTVAADDYQLEQALLNLLLNAIEAMGAEGTLTLSTTRLTSDEGQSVDPHSTARPSVLLHITDTGPGIPEALQQRLFEPFYTTKPQGTGLGLAISQRIVREHGGEIIVRSQPGKGCTFTLKLPATAG
jgi:signal transduction histidine kinase